MGKASWPSNACYLETPDYTPSSGDHVCWLENSDLSCGDGFITLKYGIGMLTKNLDYCGKPFSFTSVSNNDFWICWNDQIWHLPYFGKIDLFIKLSKFAALIITFGSGFRVVHIVGHFDTSDLWAGMVSDAYPYYPAIKPLQFSTHGI